MTCYGTVGYDLGTVGRWSRVGYGLLIAAGAAASTLVRLGRTHNHAGFLLQAALAFVGIAVAYVAVYGLLSERVFARAAPWLNTLILVGPALTVAYWNLTLGHALGVDLPAALTLAMLTYVGVSLVLQTVLGYGGCEVVALPILVFRRRYVTYCIPIVLVDAAERGWLESSGARRGLWIALGVAALGTILLGLLGIAPAVTGLAFLVVATLVAVLTVDAAGGVVVSSIWARICFMRASMARSSSR
jgi:hypothetical protein